MAVDVFVSAGEASGDLQASLLVRAMRARDPQLTVEGVGGPRLRAAGARLWRDSVAEEWASMGHLRAYAKIPWLLGVMLGIARRLLSDPPRLLVCVDFGAFNLRMIEWLRFRGYRGRIVYYFPPGAWLDNAAQARKVARASTAVTPLEHQAEFYASLNLPVHYFGHPLRDALAARTPRAPSAVPVIAVMPGSRPDEVRLLGPVLSQAAERFAAARSATGGARFVVVAATAARAEELRAMWPASCGGGGAIVAVDASSALREADVAWVASGTAVMEAALTGVPQIAFYKLTPAQYRIAQRRIPRIVAGPITLPNLVTGEAIVPELLQDDFNAERLCDLTAQLLDDDAARDRQLQGYEHFRAALGASGALERIAGFMLQSLRVRASA